VPDRLIRILETQWHPELDVGFLEVEKGARSEMTESNLDFGRILDGNVHVVGHPVTRIERDSVRREMSVTRCCFGANVLEQTETVLKLTYPIQGLLYDQAAKAWVPVALDRPHGFSGGGCFGVSVRSVGELQVIEYKLIGIQCGWHSRERWVKTIPIKHWVDLVKRRTSPL
jgi:hypothetical protein